MSGDRPSSGRVLALKDAAPHLDARLHDLSEAADFFLRQARRRALAGSLAKVALIVLGALTATSATVTQIFGEQSIATAIIYAMLGVLTSAIAGLDAAFKPQEKGAEYATMAFDYEVLHAETELRARKQLQMVASRGKEAVDNFDAEVLKICEDVDRKVRLLRRGEVQAGLTTGE